MREWMPLLALALTACEANRFADRPTRLDFSTPVIASAETPDTATKEVTAQGAGGKTPVTPRRGAGDSDPEQQLVDNFYSQRSDARGGLTKRQYRDAVIWQQIRRDNKSFDRFVDELGSDQALMNVSAEGGVILLGLLGALTGTAGEKAALSVISGGLLSARGSIDRNLFNQQTISALLSRMEAARREAIVPVKRGLTLSAEEYTLDEALVDLGAYARAGSLLATIKAITTDAGERTAVADQAIKQFTVTRDAAYRDSLDMRDALTERIEALSDDRLRALARFMERGRPGRSEAVKTLLSSRDQERQRFDDAAAAKRYLLFWLSQDDADAMEDWEQAVTLAEKDS